MDQYVCVTRVGITAWCTPLIFVHWYAVSRRKLTSTSEHMTYDVNLRELELEINHNLLGKVLHLEFMIEHEGFHIVQVGQVFDIRCGSFTVCSDIVNMADASLFCEMFNDMMQTFLQLRAKQQEPIASRPRSFSFQQEKESDDGLAVIYGPLT